MAQQNSYPKSVTFTLPSGTATIIFPSSQSPQICVNVIPPGSSWNVPLHWHESHTEFFRIRRGYALVTVGKVTRIVGPSDAVAEVKPGVLHGFSRADRKEAAKFWATYDKEGDQGGRWKEEDVEVEEWTDPSDGKKEVFFRNGMSFYRDRVQPLILAEPDKRVRVRAWGRVGIIEDSLTDAGFYELYGQLPFCSHGELGYGEGSFRQAKLGCERSCTWLAMGGESPGQGLWVEVVVARVHTTSAEANL